MIIAFATWRYAAATGAKCSLPLVSREFVMRAAALALLLAAVNVIVIVALPRGRSSLRQRVDLSFVPSSLRSDDDERSVLLGSSRSRLRGCRRIGRQERGNNETFDEIKVSKGTCRGIRREQGSSLVDERRASFLPSRAACCGEKQRAVQ